MLLLVGVDLPAPGSDFILLARDDTRTVVSQQVDVVRDDGLPGVQHLVAAVHEVVHSVHRIAGAHGAEARLGAGPAVDERGQAVRHVGGDGGEAGATYQSRPVRGGDVLGAAAWMSQLTIQSYREQSVITFVISRLVLDCVDKLHYPRSARQSL